MNEKVIYCTRCGKKMEYRGIIQRGFKPETGEPNMVKVWECPNSYLASLSEFEVHDSVEEKA